VAFSLRQAGKNYGDDCGGAREKRRIFIARGEAGKAEKIDGKRWEKCGNKRWGFGNSLSFLLPFC
jgi:hypothetical protein